MPRPKPTPEVLFYRFWSKVRIGSPDECWEWGDGYFEQGYGAFFVGGRNHGAHVVAFVYANGYVPGNGRLVHHECENKACCNPAHLADLSEKEHGRHQPLAVATHCKRGHEYTEENTYWQGPNKEWRGCRECFRLVQRKAYARKRGNPIPEE